MAGKKAGVQQTPQQKAQAEVAVQQIADFKTRWLPVQKQMAETINRMGGGESAERAQAKGMASTETAAKFGAAQTGLEAATASAGLSGSSKQKLAITGLGNDKAASAGLGVTAADQSIDDAYVQGLGSLMALGRGEKAGAMTGMSNLAEMSGRQAAQDAQLALQRRMGEAQVGGQVVGMGLSQVLKNQGLEQAATLADQKRAARAAGGGGIAGNDVGLGYGG